MMKLDDWVLCRIYMKNPAQASTIMEELSRVPLKPVASGGHKGGGNCYLDVGVLSSDGDDIIHQNASNISELPSSSCSSKATKRGLPCQLWNGGGAKQLRLDLINSYSSGVTSGAEENTVSYVSLLNQFPVQNAAFQVQPSAPLLGSLGDGVLRQHFQLPTNINWNS